LRIVITGGAGFIGSHLTEALVRLGHHVTVLDNLLTGSEDNLSGLVGHRNFEFIKHDVTQPIELDCDIIAHLASPASPVGYRKYPVETHLVNALGTYLLLEQARRVGARLLLASTSEAYGDPLIHPQREDYWGNVNPVGPRSCYDESKRFAESLAMEYFRSYGVDVRIVRIFNTYGPRNAVEDGRMVPNFINQALTGRPITVYGDGTQTRSLCYVSDMVDGLIAAMMAPDAAGEVINLGNPDERTVMDIALLIRDLCAAEVPIVHLPLPPDDPSRRCPDIGKARHLLGWEPKVGLLEGLKATIDWFRQLQCRSTVS
jgi:UDP-glucuronate decarboxylase